MCVRHVLFLASPSGVRKARHKGCDAPCLVLAGSPTDHHFLAQLYYSQELPVAIDRGLWVAYGPLQTMRSEVHSMALTDHTMFCTYARQIEKKRFSGPPGAIHPDDLHERRLPIYETSLVSGIG